MDPYQEARDQYAKAHGPPRLTIADNNVACNAPCAICGCRTDPDCGPDMFLLGTLRLVCYFCAHEFEPELYKALVAYRRLPFDPETRGRILKLPEPFDWSMADPDAPNAEVALF